MSYDAIVVGGGAIGLAIARGLAEGQSVLLIDRGPVGRESSWAAAGMLCPHSEAEEGDSLLALNLASIARYREFARDLLEETGVDLEYRDEGVIVLASGVQEYEGLQRRAAWLDRQDLDVELLSPGDVRSLEPNLSIEIEGAMFCPGDHQVRPRRLVEALRRSCLERGVEILENTQVAGIDRSENRVRGVRTAGGRFLAPTVVIAAGAWASGIEGMAPKVRLTPKKGQILSLRMPGPRFRHIVRWASTYLVPRNDGELVVGATNEACGFNPGLTVSGLLGLLGEARQLSQEVGDYPIAETWTGFRPATDDHLPAIGAADLEGLFYALGHYRNGILLAPMTAEAVVALARGQAPAPIVAPFSPARFNV